MSEPPSPTVTPTVARFRVADMDCPSCVGKIRSRLEGLDGVIEVMGSPVSRTVTVHHRNGVPSKLLQDEMGRLGYAAHALVDPGDSRESRGAAATFGSAPALRTYASIALFVTGLLMVGAGWVTPLFRTPLHVYGWPDLLFMAAAAIGGANFFGRGWRSVRAGILDMNVLMTLAIAGAAVIGETPEAAAIAFLFSVAALLESYSVDRARRSVTALMELAPDSARLLRDGVEVVVPADALEQGDHVVVRPGERLPVDGVVRAGCSAVDQAAITGESIPVDVAPGDRVFAGTVNREGALEVEASRNAGNSTLARIVRLVEEAETRTSRTERFVERFARAYTPWVTALALALALVPPLAFGAEWLPWFVRGLTLLVIACPCALVISTPVAVVSGVTAAARNGVLIKGGAHLEAMGEVRVMAFDKTGTLTVGHPRVVDVVAADGVDADDLLTRAAAVEARSEHPVARAVVDAAVERGLSVPPVTDFLARVGAGAEARIEGALHRVGKPSALEHAGAVPGDARAGGRAVVGVEREDAFLGWVILADQPRPEAAAVVARLVREGIREVVMLTGDHPDTAASVARATGVTTVRAGLLPGDKADAIRALEDEHGPVAMVGDGVNDAPALATASVGIAMGAAGSDTALETADIALMGDDLGALPYLGRLARTARRVIRQNVAAALMVKGALVVGVALGHVSLVAAVLVGDLGLSLAVIANALRLGRVDP